VPEGDPGQLFVRGPTVMQGYWGDPERTARTLIGNPVLRHLPDRCYHTGDVVQQLPDGNLRFLGRRDAQVKSRGYRIELGDIEAAFYAHPDVVECAAVAVPDDVVTNRIKLFVVAKDDASQSDLTRFAAMKLPKYMLPDSYDFLDALPKTSTGKVDRRSLAVGPIREETR
jgi:acyl-CoA synthetase (AMP-forming)/AMP-acid ligase II